jgi:hypothetical protein
MTLVFEINGNGKAIHYNAKVVDLATGQLVTEVNGDDIHYLELVSIPEPLSKYSLIISSPGFTTETKPLSYYFPTPDTYNNTAVVNLKSGINILQIGILTAGLYALVQKKRRVGKLDSGEVMNWALIAVGVLGFSFVKQILESLGIWKSRDTKDLDNASTDPNSWWNPLWFTSKPLDVSYTYAISRATADAYAREIYNAFGPVNDCEECAIAVFKRCKTKANASFISYAFNQLTGQDLLSFLRGGSWPQDRLSDSDVATINNYINSLPNW